jgi:hypothetical protein
LILFGVRKNCLSSGRRLIIVPVYKKGDETAVIIKELKCV